MIRFMCAKCQATMETADEYAGQTANCTTCGQPLVIPSLQARPLPPEPHLPSSVGRDVTPMFTPPREVARSPARPEPPRGPRRRRRDDDYDDYDDDYDDYDYRPRRRPPPGYGPRYRPRSDGMGVGAFVCGLLGLILIVLFWPVGVVLCFVGMILGFSSLKGSSRGMAIAGLTLSIIGLALVAIGAFFVVALLSSVRF